MRVISEAPEPREFVVVCAAVNWRVMAPDEDVALFRAKRKGLAPISVRPA